MDVKLRLTWKNVALWVSWGLVFALYLAWPLTHLDAYLWTNDEGLYMQRAALTNAGYPLYTETAFTKPPLLIWILRAAFRVAGPTLPAARLTVLCLTLMGFVATGVMARQLWGRWAGVAAMAMLLCLPELPVRAHVVMAGLPSMAVALVALAAAILFQYRRRRGWIVLSGAALAGALLIHPVLIFSTVPLALILFLPNSVLGDDKPLQRATGLEMLLFLAPILLAGALTVAAVDRRSFFTWVFQSNYQAARDVPRDENWNMIAGLLGSSWALVGLSIASSAVLSTFPRRRRALSLLAAWWLTACATLLALSPLWRQYLIFLAFPLAIVSGGGIVAAGRRMLRLRRRTWRQGGLRALWAVLTIVWLTAFGLNRWEKTRPKLLEGPEWSLDHLAARSFIEEKVPPDGFVATDDPLLSLAAGRLVQPPFTEASKKQIEMGNFTTEGGMEGMLRYGSEAALFSTGRLILLPGFEEWVSEVATERREFDELRAYRLDLPRQEPVSTLARFENGIELRGYALSRGVLHPGDVLTVVLFWGGTGRVREDNHVFVHLVHEGGGLWGQHDGPPQGGERPTSQWEENELICDVHRVTLSPEAPPGTYLLTVGMYPWPSLERVPAFLPDGGRWPQNRAVVMELSLVSP